MGKSELKELILNFIQNKRLGIFDFEDVRKVLLIVHNQGKSVEEFDDDIPPDQIDMANDILWDLVFERKINPAPYGSGKSESSKFFIKKS